MDFKIYSIPEEVSAETLTIASATVIEKGDLVALTSGLVTKAVAADTALWIAVSDSAVGDTTILVISDSRVILSGTADANFAVTNKGTEVDLVGTTTQLIDLGTSTTDVLKVIAGENAGTVGSTKEVLVRINKTL